MLKPIKLSIRDNKIVFLSDNHGGHNPIWRPTLYQLRGFNSIQEHDEWFIKKWYELIDEKTVVIDLGDSHFKDFRGEKFLQYTKLPCAEHFYCWGNHRSGAKQVYSDALKDKGLEEYEEVYPLKVNNLTFVGDSLHLWIDGHSVYCQHFAQYIWPEINKDGFCCVGHSHSNAAELNPNNDKIGKILDIGVDNAIKYNGTPFFTWQEVRTILNKKKTTKIDHH